MARENGYYWVKFEVPEGKWTILKWSVERWWGGEYTFIDNDFEAIDERRIIDPNEQSNCNLPHVSNLVCPTHGTMLYKHPNGLAYCSLCNYSISWQTCC